MNGPQAGLGALNKASADQCAFRETAQGIAKRQAEEHGREHAAWRWLDAAMEIHRPTAEEEIGLWNLLSRARRERY